MKNGELETIFPKLQSILVRLLGKKGMTQALVTPDASLVDDLAMDSFDFVNLTVALEVEFSIKRFPMQRWVDAQAARQTKRFAVSSLAEAVRVCTLA